MYRFDEEDYKDPVPSKYEAKKQVRSFIQKMKRRIWLANFYKKKREQSQNK